MNASSGSTVMLFERRSRCRKRCKRRRASLGTECKLLSPSRKYCRLSETSDRRRLRGRMRRRENNAGNSHRDSPIKIACLLVPGKEANLFRRSTAPVTQIKRGGVKCVCREQRRQIWLGATDFVTRVASTITLKSCDAQTNFLRSNVGSSRNRVKLLVAANKHESIGKNFHANAGALSALSSRASNGIREHREIIFTCGPSSFELIEFP